MAPSDADIRTMIAKLDKIAERQEALIIATGDLAETIDLVVKQMAELVEWANEPPSHALEEALDAIAAGLKAVGDQQLALPQQVAALVVSSLRAP
jgi:hypothetical protein